MLVQIYSGFFSDRELGWSQSKGSLAYIYGNSMRKLSE
jgi:hypothetical protein